MDIQRKRFCGALGAGTVLLLLQACGGGGDDTPAPAGGPLTATIANNHPTPHALTVPAADLDSAVDMTYSIQGAADHRHDVTFTPAQLKQIKAGTTVTVTSTTTFGHSHDVSLG